MTKTIEGECPVCESGGYTEFWDSPVASIEFDEQFKTMILNEEKTCTIRYNIVGDIATGDVVSFHDTDREVFAWAKITGRMRITAENIVQSDFDGHRNYAVVEELALSLREFYPDAYIGPDTLLDVLWFNVVIDDVSHSVDNEVPIVE